MLRHGEIKAVLGIRGGNLHIQIHGCKNTSPFIPRIERDDDTGEGRGKPEKNSKYI